MPKCSSKTKIGKRCQRSVQKVGDVCSCHKDMCSICMDMIENDNSTLPCGHQYHKPCIEKWEKEGHNTCPCCRKMFKETQYSALITLYPRNTRGDARLIPLPDQLIEQLLTSLNMQVDEIDNRGDNINLEFDDNQDLIDYFEELGVSIEGHLA